VVAKTIMNVMMNVIVMTTAVAEVRIVIVEMIAAVPHKTIVDAIAVTTKNNQKAKRLREKINKIRQLYEAFAKSKKCTKLVRKVPFLMKKHPKVVFF